MFLPDVAQIHRPMVISIELLKAWMKLSRMMMKMGMVWVRVVVWMKTLK